MAEDAVLLPFFQFPTSLRGEPTRSAAVDQDAANYQAFQNIWAWEDINGDGQIVIGAEQWPECLARSRSVPTPRGWSGRRRSRSFPRCGTPPVRTYVPVRARHGRT